MLVHQFGRFVSATRYDRLPADVVEAIKVRILDVLAAGLVGCRLGAHERLLPLYNGAGQATVWGAGAKLPVREAALVNSFMAHSTYLEDGSRYTGGHPASVVIPGALALAESRHSSGTDLIAAVTAGYEVFLRLGGAIYPSTVVRGFQSTAVLGAASCAASCASLLRLDAAAAKNAIAIGCNLGVGLKEALKSSDSQPIQVGRSCEGGILAAQLAAAGATGADAIIEEGFLRAFADGAAAAGIADGLGTEYRVSETYLKIHGGCRGNHAPVDVAQDLVRDHSVRPDEIAALEVRVDSVTYAAEIHQPVNGNQAQFSVAFAVAVALVKGDASVFRYTDETLADPNVRAMMKRICVVVDTSLDAGYPDKRGATAEARLRDGRRLTAHIDNAKGEPESPLSAADIERKFMTLAGELLGPAAERVRDLVIALERVDDVHALAACLHGQSGLAPD